MGGRLVLALVSLVIAAGLDGIGRDLGSEARAGIYWTVTFAFFAAVISGSAFGRIRHPTRFAAVQIVMDVAIVTSLVHFSGGHESVFTFLYVLVILYGALLFKRRVALGAAGFSAAAYGLALLTANEGWGLGAASAVAEPMPLPGLLAVWSIHGGGLMLVGALASVLTWELQRAGAALDQSTNDLQMLKDLHRCTVESIMSGLLTTDSDGCIMTFNPEAEKITGQKLEEVLGRRLHGVIPGAWEMMTSGWCRAGVESSRARLGFRNARGEELFLGLASSELRDESAADLGYVVIFQDVTRVVAMEAELRRSERLAAVGELSAKIAHEIRNPLASITGSIQILQSDLEESGEDNEPARLMNIVVRETDRLNELITDFLVYARPAPLRPEVVDLESLLDEFAKVFGPARPDTVSMRVSIAEKLAVEADPGQLRQTLWNLCLNAVQAMPEGGRLTISAERCAGESPQGMQPAHRNDEGIASADEGGETFSASRDPGVAASWVQISVADDGPGIPADVQERIFEPFFTTKKSGTGLGLATVHRIIENHGGELELVSGAGRGTTFRIKLPVVREMP
jgi:two-component system sensor histidine kinase PilS (NtrC family)